MNQPSNQPSWNFTSFMPNHLTPSILLVEEGFHLRELLADHLKQHAFLTHFAHSARQALQLIDQKQPFLIMVDSKLSDQQALLLCKSLRRDPHSKNIPILLFKHEDVPLEGVPSYEEGGPNEVVAYPGPDTDFVSAIKLIFRRYRATHNTQLLEYEGVEMNLASYKVTRNGSVVHLGPTEFRILQCLMEYPWRIHSREYIMSYVWGKRNSIELRTIDVHINRLRGALKSANDDEPFIQTIRSAGYCLRRPKRHLHL